MLHIIFHLILAKTFNHRRMKKKTTHDHNIVWQYLRKHTQTHRSRTFRPRRFDPRTFRPQDVSTPGRLNINLELLLKFLTPNPTLTITPGSKRPGVESAGSKRPASVTHYFKILFSLDPNEGRIRRANSHQLSKTGQTI